MIYGSVCSGIECVTVAWTPLNWKAAFYSEIDPQACAVLAHYYPNVPNLGDIRNVGKKSRSINKSIDLLAGGTPCQSFSVAGLRGGLDDDRGNLTLEFLRIVEDIKPKYVLWENVPGVLSIDDGNTFQLILDRFTQMGYIVDVDILDAQYFGVPQRRRRVFVICVKLSVLLQKKTCISARIVSELVAQALLATWDAIPQVLSLDKSRLELENQIEKSKDFLKKKMKLLDALWGGSMVTNSLDVLAAQLHPSMEEQIGLESIFHQSAENVTAGSKMDIGGSSKIKTKNEFGVKSIELLWNDILAVILNLRKESITSTLIDKTIESKICSFAKAIVHIVRYTQNLLVHYQKPEQYEDCWNLILLNSTLLKGVINYARQASSDLFTETSVRDRWRYNLNEAQNCSKEFERNIRKRSDTCQILLECPGVPRNIKKSKKAGEEIARSLRAQSNCSHREDSDNYIPTKISAVTSKWAKGSGGPADDECQNLIVFSCKDNGRDASEKAPTLRAFNHDKSHESGGGQVAVVYENHAQDSRVKECGDTAPTLSKKFGTGGGNIPIVGAFKVGQGGKAGGIGYDESKAPTLGSASSGTQQSPGLVKDMTVRRLTPRECERLQGLPDDYSLVPYKGKLMSDAARYRMIGNGMAVPVIRWIGERIDAVSQIISGL